MKKSISILLCFILIISSFSFVFAADWSTTDSNNLSSIKNAVTSGGGLYNLVSNVSTTINNVSTTLTNVNNRLTQIYNSLNYNNRSVADWVQAISTWMSPIFNAISQTPMDLQIIQGLLGYPTIENGVTTWNPYLLGVENMSKALTNYFGYGHNMVAADARLNAHQNLFSDASQGLYNIARPLANGTYETFTRRWGAGSPLGNIMLMLQMQNLNDQMAYSYRWAADLTGYNDTQVSRSWANLSNYTFTPTSFANGVYTWLKRIQDPVSRLSYVLASDQRIEAQEAAAANEQSVVDNFIDSSGSGAASTSDFASIASFSSGYENTFTSDASPTGIFDIFNSNNMGWFSQETANQLDTTSNTRAKYDNTFNTPLLDQQITDIYEQLGVKQP